MHLAPGEVTALDEVTPEETEDADRDNPRYGFIHLEDVRYHTGGVNLPSEGPGTLWRGRWSEVTGWSQRSPRRGRVRSS